MFKILYLEDDINLSETIVEFLEDNDFEVIATYSGNETLNILYEEKIDLLIFDVNLPDINGFELLKQLREANINIPAIFTTTLNDIDSVDQGYIVGADDYLRKPFALKELLHRINVLLKRIYNTEKESIYIDDILFNLKTNELTKANKMIKLSQKESLLLKLFIQHKNKVISLDTIYTYVWNANETHSESSLRTYIKNLRKVFGKDKIESIKKQGYKFVF